MKGESRATRPKKEGKKKTTNQRQCPFCASWLLKSNLARHRTKCEKRMEGKEPFPSKLKKMREEMQALKEEVKMLRRKQSSF